jgi:hypothetical protein
MFYEPLTGFFLRLARAVPKSLMQADPAATIKAFRMLEKGGIVSIFPEGQISPMNRTLTPAYSIAKFLKKANVDVYIVKHMGAGLVNPPWSKYSFKGKIETIKKLIINKTALKDMSLDEIYQKLKDELFYSASIDNLKKKYKYQIKPIMNLENVIYQCPSCLYEGLTSHKNQLICPSCKHTLTYDQYGLLNGEGLDTLFLKQEARVRKEIDAHKAYHISGKTKLMSFRNHKLIVVGEGTLTINKEAYIYRGTIDGEDKILSFKVSSTPTLPSDIGRNVQIYEDNMIYQFEIDIPWLPTKIVHVGEYMFEMSINSI